MWPKLRILQFNFNRSSSGNFCVETECWEKMVLLFMARSNSYKTRRQLVHCCIDVLTIWRNVVVNLSYFVQNSQTTRVLSYRCCYYSKKCRSKLYVISRHYTVLCRSKSYGTRNNSHYVAMVDRRSRTRKSLRLKAKCVRELYDNLRVSYEISTRNAPHTLDGELWQDF